MFPRDLSKYATATLAAIACGFVVSGVRAGEMDDTQGVEASTAYFQPFSAPCHPSIDRGACIKRLHYEAQALRSDATTVAPVYVAIDQDPVSAPCHPARKGCADWARSDAAK